MNVLHIRHCHPFHDDTPTNWTVLTPLRTEAADTQEKLNEAPAIPTSGGEVCSQLCSFVD